MQSSGPMHWHLWNQSMGELWKTLNMFYILEYQLFSQDLIFHEKNEVVIHG